MKAGAGAIGAEGAAKTRSKRVRLVARSCASLALLGIAVAVVLAYAEPTALERTARDLSPSALGAALAALLVGALVASGRVRLVADDLGYRLSWRDALATLGVGQLGGAMFFQIAGQLIARGAFLSRRGVPVGATIMMVGYERVLALGVSLVLAAAGAWHIFGYIALDFSGGGDAFLKLLAGLVMAAIFGAWLGWGRLAVTSIMVQRAKAEERSERTGFTVYRRALRGVLVSLTIQVATMAAYVVLVKSLAPDVPILDLAAASTVVMLAASLPISLAGWGVRELSAVLALGAIGVPPAAALLAAASIGVGSLLVVAPLASLALFGNDRPPPAPVREPGREIDYGRLVALAVPLVAATVVFFQIHVPTAAGGLNVNLADPAAILGGVLFVLSAAWSRNWPAWRLSGLNLHILIATAVMAVALLIGASRFGWTNWALTNKFLGWFVLLGYAGTGALIVAAAGKEGRRLLLLTLTAAGCAVALLELMLIAAQNIGFTFSRDVLWQDATGFSQNRNAFAFQMLMVAAAGIAVGVPRRLATVVLVISTTALWYAGSRAGGLALIVLLGVGIRCGMLSLKQTGIVLAGSVALVLAISAPEFVTWDGTSTVGPDFTAIEPLAKIYDESSTTERIKSFMGGLALFASHPILGAGLGAHVEQTLQATGTPLVIHSTPVWLLAEMGVVGLLAFLVPVVRIFLRAWNEDMRDSANRLLVLMIVVLASVTIAHEMLYQRTFWLLFGTALAFAGPSAASFREQGAAGDRDSKVHASDRRGTAIRTPPPPSSG